MVDRVHTDVCCWPAAAAMIRFFFEYTTESDDDGDVDDDVIISVFGVVCLNETTTDCCCCWRVSKYRLTFSFADGSLEFTCGCFDDSSQTIRRANPSLIRDNLLITFIRVC